MLRFSSLSWARLGIGPDWGCDQPGCRPRLSPSQVWSFVRIGLKSATLPSGSVETVGRVNQHQRLVAVAEIEAALRIAVAILLCNTRERVVNCH